MKIKKQNKAKTPKQVIKAAEWMLTNIGWCQGALSKSDEDGNYSGFCLLGALIYAEASEKTLAQAKSLVLDAIKKQYPICDGSFIVFNDDIYRTKDEVLDLLKGIAK